MGARPLRHRVQATCRIRWMSSRRRCSSSAPNLQRFSSLSVRLRKLAHGQSHPHPGNHELWLRREERETFPDSLAKLDHILGLCCKLGVLTEPRKVGDVTVVPILSWHHSSFDTEPDIEGYEDIPPAHIVMRDFHLCRWPVPLDPMNESVAKRLDQLNDLKADGRRRPDGLVLS